MASLPRSASWPAAVWTALACMALGGAAQAQPAAPTPVRAPAVAPADPKEDGGAALIDFGPAESTDQPVPDSPDTMRQTVASAPAETEPAAAVASPPNAGQPSAAAAVVAPTKAADAAEPPSVSADGPSATPASNDPPAAAAQAVDSAPVVNTPAPAAPREPAAEAAAPTAPPAPNAAEQAPAAAAAPVQPPLAETPAATAETAEPPAAPQVDFGPSKPVAAPAPVASPIDFGPSPPTSAAASPALRAATVDAFVGPYALEPAGDPSSPQFVGPPLVPPFMLLHSEVPPGTRKQLRWSAAQSFAGGDSVAPVNVVHGSRPGPVLCLTAAIHGDEINGVEIVRRVLNGADPQRLSGTLIAVPIVNLFGFSRSSRYLPDRRDLNRFFPGSKRGSIASRIADSFFVNVARRCDSIVDFHTGSFDRANLPQVRADLRLPDVLRFSRGFGALPVLHSNGSKGMLRVAATQMGIPAVTFEVGAPGTLEPKEIETAVAAVWGLMHYLGMTPDEPMEQEPQAIFYDSMWVRANAGGMLMSGVELGQRVQRGERLGVVVDPIKNIERPIVSPVFGRVIGMARNQVVLPGFAAFHLGEETSAEQASDAAASGEMESEVEEDPDPTEAAR